MKNLGAYRKVAKQKLSQREKTELIEKYSPLVKTLTFRIMGKISSPQLFEDLLAAGTVGLLEAIESYDPSLMVKFETFATFRIRGAMFDELRHKDWIPRSVRTKLKELELLQRKLASEFSKSPSDSDMAKALNMNLEEYYELVASIQPGMIFSYEDLGFKSLSEKSALDYLEDKSSPNPDCEMQFKELKNKIISAFEKLEKDEQLVMALYYYEELTLKEIAEVMQITESRVSQIHSKALLKLHWRLDELKKQLDDLKQKS